MHTMAMRLGFKFSRYRLIPSGSHSRLERIDDSAKELPLYSSGGFKLFSDTKFDQAMVSFLECLQQFKLHVEGQDTHFKLPYRSGITTLATASATPFTHAHLHLPAYCQAAVATRWHRVVRAPLMSFALFVVRHAGCLIATVLPNFLAWLSASSIEKDKIGDSNGRLSIRIQGNHEETWTKALKYMLTNLKW